MIRPANPYDAAILTRISFAAKGYWGYPKAYFEVWKNELTLTTDYIEKNDVHVYQLGATVTGYYSIVNLPKDISISGIRLTKGFWLDHMFVNPPYSGIGIGSKLFRHLEKRCEEMGIREVGILADPNSRGFYEKMGCLYIIEFASSIKNRTTPYLMLRL